MPERYDKMYFPSNEDKSNGIVEQHGGVTFREVAAKDFMAALIISSYGSTSSSILAMSVVAVKAADALAKELNNAHGE